VSRGLILLIVVMLGGQTALAQPAFLQPQSTVIRNARILAGDGRVIEQGTILVRRGVIAAVVEGEMDEMPRRATVVDAEGRTITPGLIDVHSRLAMTDTAGTGPLERAADAFNRYDRVAIDEALSHGVTTLYLPALGGSVSGTGSIVRLGADDVEIVDETAALHIDLGSERPALQRLGQFEAIGNRFKQARAWRDSVEIYADELLPEYEKKIAERAEKEAEEGEAGDGDDSASLAGGEDLQPRPIRRGGRGGSGRGGAPAGRGGGGGGGDGDEIRKPSEPNPNREAEMLLRAIDGELVVRVLAHRAEDILNALELADTYNLKMVIEGGNEAGLVAAELAAANVPVVLGPAGDTSPYAPERYRARDPHAMHQLTGAGVRWVLGTGGPNSSRFVLFNAQMAAARSDADPLSLVTRDAAAFLGLDDSGVIRRGARADLVMWTDDPMTPGASVAGVWVAGKTAWQPAGEDSE
jgi:hypothetical protein